MLWSTLCNITVLMSHTPCAGAEAGDGRDESNKSLQERLADATNAQTAADAEAKAADIRAKHLTKQASEQRRALGAKDKEASRLQAELAAAQRAVDKCQAALEVCALCRYL